jgi:hypothetical protein
MTGRRLSCGLIVIVAITACDPLFSTEYRQPIAPLSPDQCVEAALQRSPHIAVVSREKNPYDRAVTSAYHIVVRDSATIGGDWDGEAARERRGDSTWVRVSYSYMGYATPRRTDRARWEGEAHDILETVRARCAPDVPSAITCKGVGGIFGQKGACSTRG